MKMKLLFIVIAIGSCVYGFSQVKPVLKPNTLPTPNIQPLKAADLQVTSISIVSSETKTLNKVFYVTVNVTIKNFGQVDAPASQLSAYCQKAGDAAAEWKRFDNTVGFPVITGGQSVPKNCVFKIPVSNVGSNRVTFRVLADAAGNVHESIENNNYSQGILIGL